MVTKAFVWLPPSPFCGRSQGLRMSRPARQKNNIRSGTSRPRPRFRSASTSRSCERHGELSDDRCSCRSVRGASRPRTRQEGRAALNPGRPLLMPPSPSWSAGASRKRARRPGSPGSRPFSKSSRATDAVSRPTTARASPGERGRGLFLRTALSGLSGAGRPAAPPSSSILPSCENRP